MALCHPGTVSYLWVDLRSERHHLHVSVSGPGFLALEDVSEHLPWVLSCGQPQLTLPTALWVGTLIAPHYWRGNNRCKEVK